MSSNRISLLRSFAVRLSLWYALIFAVSTGALLVLVYYLVAHEPCNARTRKSSWPNSRNTPPSIRPAGPTR